MAFDRNAYQRDLMRKRRAAERSPKLLERIKAMWPELALAEQAAFVEWLGVGKLAPPAARPPAEPRERAFGAPVGSLLKTGKR